MGTLRSLSRGPVEDFEVIFCDDRSTIDYTWVEPYLKFRFPYYKKIATGDYDAFRWNGNNCPVYAFNRCLEAAEGAIAIAMSSEILVPPSAMQAALQNDPQEMVYTPGVIDTESFAQYCGPKRIFPMPWFLAFSRKIAIDIGGWDETYLDGTCFDDNDFAGRLALATGRFVGDWEQTVYHQSHHQLYEETKTNVALKAAWDKNRAYTKRKWSGIPFDHELVPFDVVRTPHESGNIAYECTAEGTLLADTIAATKGLRVPV